jgi:hypothetical protein
MFRKLLTNKNQTNVDFVDNFIRQCDSTLFKKLLKYDQSKSLTRVIWMDPNFGLIILEFLNRELAQSLG